MAFELEYKHDQSDQDARARIRALGQYLSNKHGIGVTWQGDDQAKISGKYLVVTIDGTVQLSPGTVRFSGKDPGMLWRGKAKDYLLKKLQKYLDGSTPIDQLPTGG